jgi:DNA-binding beta-propeller fold protein YncE
MKSTKNVAHIAATLLCLAVFASASFAATSPLNNPRGLAVDAKGNLYVANIDANNILVYSPGYALQKKATITQNLNLPTSVAFDPFGNLWVANGGASNGSAYGSVAEYSGGKPTGVAITNGVVQPLAMAIDGLGDIWVENQFTNITVYASQSIYAQPITLVQTLTVNPPVYGVAVAGDYLAYGNGNGTILDAVEPILTSNAQNGGSYGNMTGVAIGSDNKGNFYVGNADGSVDIAFANGTASTFLFLSFAPTGISVDNVRGRIYISNGPGNSISVYSTAGALLKVIQ